MSETPAVERKIRKSISLRRSLGSMTNRSGERNIIDLCSSDSESDGEMSVAATSRHRIDGSDCGSEHISDLSSGVRSRQINLTAFFSPPPSSRCTQRKIPAEVTTKASLQATRRASVDPASRSQTRDLAKEERTARFKRKPRFHWRDANNQLHFQPPKKRIFTACEGELATALCEMRLHRDNGRYTSLDLEWNFNRRSGRQRKPGVIQIASAELVIIYSVDQKANSLPACLIHYLSDPDILKIGVGVKSVDATKLLRDYPDLPPIRGLFELSTLVKAVDRPRWEKRSIGGLISLQELTYTYLDAYLEKGNERTSNWENKGPWNPKAKQMTSKQLDYASGDVVAGLLIFRRIIEQLPSDFDLKPLVSELAAHPHTKERKVMQS